MGVAGQTLAGLFGSYLREMYKEVQNSPADREVLNNRIAGVIRTVIGNYPEVESELELALIRDVIEPWLLEPDDD